MALRRGCTNRLLRGMLTDTRLLMQLKCAACQTQAVPAKKWNAPLSTAADLMLDLQAALWGQRREKKGGGGGGGNPRRLGGGPGH